MAAQVQFNKTLKEGVTDAKYQSTFLPIFQDAETRIKTLILLAFLDMKSPLLLRMAIAAIINDVAAKIPDSLHDKQAYIEGMRKRSELYIRNYYNQPKRTFEMARSRLVNTKPADVELPKIVTPRELMNYTKQNKRSMWPEAKATPYISNYSEEVFKKMDEFAATPMTTFEPGKKPISLWQKAELDVRYNKQMKMLQDLKDSGVEYAWTSSHADASKRCEPWQGKLMDLNRNATMTGFRVGKIDGHWVYSLTDIMAQTDKYGYHNNIICGFNCRHRLIAYQPDKAPPKKYTKEEVAEQRKIEERIRRMEREIRLQKTRLLFYERIGEKKIVQNLRQHIKILIERYKNYCERNGYAWYEYRIKIREGSNKYL